MVNMSSNHPKPACFCSHTTSWAKCCVIGQNFMGVLVCEKWLLISFPLPEEQLAEAVKKYSRLYNCSSENGKDSQIKVYIDGQRTCGRRLNSVRVGR